MSFPEHQAPPTKSALERLLFKSDVEGLWAREAQWAGGLSAAQLVERYHALKAEGARVVIMSQPEGREVSEFELHKMAESA
jgi:hypothetical protein